MANPSGQKGTKWETAIVNFLASCGLPAGRKPRKGSKDQGDLSVEGVPGITIEAKNCRGASLAAWVDEAVTEAENAGVPVGVVWHHRRGKASPGDGYVTMRGDHFVKLVRELRRVRRAELGRMPGEQAAYPESFGRSHTREKGGLLCQARR